MQTHRGRRVSAGTKGQSWIKHHIDCILIRNIAPARANPQAFAETHRVEVIHPLAFPVFIFQLFDFMREACAEQRMLLKDSNRFVHVAFCVEQTDNVGIAPQTGFTRQRFEHRRVVGVLEGNRDRAGLHQRVAQFFRVSAGRIQF